MDNFNNWNEQLLQDYLLFLGKNTSGKGRHELVALASKAYSKDRNSLERFQENWALSGGSTKQSVQRPVSQANPATPAAGHNPYAMQQNGGPAYPPAGAYPPPAYPPAAGGGAGYPPAGTSPAYPAMGGASYPPVAGQAYPPAAGATPAYPPVAGPPQPGAYPTGGGAYPNATPAAGAYPPAAGAYPQAAGAYPPAAGAYPPAAGAYPPAAGAYPPVAGAYPTAASGGLAYPPGAAKTSNPGYPYAAPAAATPSSPPAQASAPPRGSGSHAPSAHPHHAPAHAPQAQHAPTPGGDGRRRKALLIGCNYPGTSAALAGCCNDAVMMQYLLKSKFAYTDVRLLRDDEGNNHSTRRNILAGIDWLVEDCREGDSLFFHFSGHGSQKRDYSGDEADGMNETICPSDFKSAGQIVDDELNARLVRRIGKGVILHALLDACHSGTGMDLPFVVHMDRNSGRTFWTSEQGRQYKGTSGGLAVQFGACKDSQTAADTSSLSHDRTSTGAATFLFIQAVEHLHKRHQALTYENVLADMLRQIKTFNQQAGRGVDGGTTGRPIGGGLLGGLMGAVIGEVLGGITGGAMGGRMSGQTPQLSASEQFALTSRVCL